MDADARRRVAALEQELRRLQNEVELLQAEQVLAPGAAKPEVRLNARWLAVGGGAVLALAMLLFLRDAAQWLTPTLQIACATSVGIVLWGTGIYLHARRLPMAHPVAGSGVVVTALAAYAAHGLYSSLGTTLEGTALVLGAVAVAALLDAGLRQAESQAVIAALLVPATAAVGLAWTTFSLSFTVAMAVALLATAAWQRFRAVPILVALGTGSILVSHAFVGAATGPVFGAAMLLWVAFTAVAWTQRHQADIVVQSVVWLATWGVGAWSMARWGIGNGWWTAATGVFALRLSLAPAPEMMRRTWRTMGIVALVVFPVQLPWPDAAAAVWLVELALAVAYRLHRSSAAAQAAVAALSAVVAVRLLAYEAPRIDGSPNTALATWLAATLVMGLSWFMDRRSGALLPRAQLGLAAGGILLLVALLLDGPAVGFVWMAIAGALVAEGMSARSLDLRIAGLGTFGAAIVHLVLFDLFAVNSAWRVLVFAGIGILLLLVSWVWWERSAPASDAP